MQNLIFPHKYLGFALCFASTKAEAIILSFWQRGIVLSGLLDGFILA